jgi:hypothetical protein
MMEERDLETMARGLGRSRAEALDLERVAKGVVERLRGEAVAVRSSRPVWWAPRLVRLAAAVVLFLAGGILFSNLPRGGERVARPVVPQLYELSEEQLVEILDSLAFEMPVFERVVGLSDLDEVELRELLRAMEG